MKILGTSFNHHRRIGNDCQQIGSSNVYELSTDVLAYHAGFFGSAPARIG